MIGTPAAALDLATCVANPVETAGPFPADGTNSARGRSETLNVLTQSGVLRRDLRPSFAGLTPVADGVSLQIELYLVSASDGCTPLPGHALYPWHCDAVGNYSLYDDPDRNDLRGLAISDDAGIVRFTTAFPGCYRSRYPHFHLEVFASADDAVTGRDSLLISQTALPETACAEVYDAHPAYSNGTRNLGRNSFEGDGVFRNGGVEGRAQQMMEISGSVAAGYTARAIIGL